MLDQVVSGGSILCSRDRPNSRFLTWPSARFGMTRFNFRNDKVNLGWALRGAEAPLFNIVRGGLLLRGLFGYGLLEIIQRHSQALLQLNLWLPSQQLAGFCDVGAALLGIVLG